MPIASIFLFFVFPNHQDKTNPIKKTCKIKLCFCLIILVTKILCHSNIHKLYTLNCLFPHTIIYICSIITITSFVVKGDGKFLPFLFCFEVSHSSKRLKHFYAIWWAAASCMILVLFSFICQISVTTVLGGYSSSSS